MLNQSLMKLPEVVSRTTLSKSHIYKLIQENAFPAPIKLTQRCVAWVAGDIDAWITNAIQSTKEVM
jgi:prophage regulatory protein